MDTIKDTTLYSGNSESAFGRIIKNAGDLNKDGVLDFAVLTGGSTVYLFLGIDDFKCIKWFIIWYWRICKF